MSTRIQAIDEITVPYPAAEVWSVLADVGGYARWWPKSVRIRVLSGDATLPGAALEIHPVGGRPFRCRVEAVEEPTRIHMRYGDGFIDGWGEWRLAPVGTGTRVTYVLDVQAHGWLVTCLGKCLNLGNIHSRSMQTILHRLNAVLVDRHRATPSRA